MSTDDTASLRGIVDSILESYRSHGETSHLEGSNLPSREAIWAELDEPLP